MDNIFLLELGPVVGSEDFSFVVVVLGDVSAAFGLGPWDCCSQEVRLGMSRSFLPSAS